MMMYLLKLVFKIVKYTLYLFLVLLLALAMWWLTYRVYRHKICAVLPNGLLIGHAALFDLDKPYWTPNVTIKLPDGTSLIKEYVDLFYFSDTTAYGWAGPNNSPVIDYGFAYRPDIGFAKSTDEPEKYQKLRAEAGLPLGGAEVLGYPTNTNLLYVYYKLIESPDYRREYCPLSILP